MGNEAEQKACRSAFASKNGIAEDEWNLPSVREAFADYRAGWLDRAAQPPALPERGEGGDLVHAARAMLIAVEYGGLTALPNGAGKGYLPRVPDQFVVDLKAALAALPELSTAPQDVNQKMLEALKIYADFPKTPEGQFRKGHWYEVIDAGEIARDAIACAEQQKEKNDAE